MSSGDTRVFSIADGVVCFAGSNGTTQDAYKLSESQRKGNGYCIVIRHNIDGKTVYSFYGHLKEGSFKVSNNQTVKAGQQIATMGNTGRSTAPHLHFAIANGYSAGKYYGYTSNCKTFYSNTKTRGVTFYNPAYVLQYKKLP